MGLKHPPKRFFFPFFRTILPKTVFLSYMAYSFLEYSYLYAVIVSSREASPHNPANLTIIKSFPEEQCGSFCEMMNGMMNDPAGLHGCNHTYIKIGRSLCKMTTITTDGRKAILSTQSLLGLNSINQYSNSFAGEYCRVLEKERQ